MGLFKADLYRSFAIGFVVGAALLGAAMSVKSESPMGIPAASAAPVLPDQTLGDPAQPSNR